MSDPNSVEIHNSEDQNSIQSTVVISSQQNQQKNLSTDRATLTSLINLFQFDWKAKLYAFLFFIVIILTLIVMVLPTAIKQAKTAVNQRDSFRNVMFSDRSQETSYNSSNDSLSQQPSLLPPISVMPTITPNSSVTPSESAVVSTITSYTTKQPTPTYAPSPIPTKTVPSATPMPSVTPRATFTPTPADSQPPSIYIQGGPGEGSINNFKNFCFPLSITDNKSNYPNLWYAYSFDNNSWSSWINTDMSPCFNNVQNGMHSIKIKAKDQAGNESSAASRNFQIFGTGKISGRAFVDYNNNNSYDSGDNVMGGIKVFLYKREGSYVYSVTSTTADSMGYYTLIFDDPQGTFQPQSDPTIYGYIQPAVQQVKLSSSTIEATVNFIFKPI